MAQDFHEDAPRRSDRGRDPDTGEGRNIEHRDERRRTPEPGERPPPPDPATQPP